MNKQLSLKKIAAFLIILFLTGHLLMISRSILTPLVFAAFFALMLKPMVERVESKVKKSIPSILLTFLMILIPIVGVLWIFSSQLATVMSDLPSITGKLEESTNIIFKKLNSQFGMSKSESEQMLSQNLSGSFGFLTTGLSVSGAVVVNFFLCIIYTFLLVLYRNSIREFILIQVSEKERENTEGLLGRVQSVVQDYLYGMVIVIGILGSLNSLGLYLIGIEYALLWGFLAAFLAIIPYVGTAVGGLLPFLFALATTGTFWQPAAVVALFTTVQFVEGNVITPLVVGNSISINPLAAILALLIGGSIWGVAGMVLALPIIAILKIYFKQIDYLKPVSLLLSDEIYAKGDIFEERFDKERFRFRNLFRKEA